MSPYLGLWNLAAALMLTPAIGDGFIVSLSCSRQCRLNTLHASQKSYKWIRYAIGVVTGAEGIFCTSPDLQTVVDDNADLPADSVDLYYHTSVEERERTFPIDPDITRSQTTSDVYTERRDKFCDDVAVRDSERCVLTGVLSRACKAAHLIAHSKGDEACSSYFQSVFAHRCTVRSP